MSVCLSVCMEQLGYQRTDFRKNFEYFTKICQGIRVSLKSDTKNGGALHEDRYTFSIICRQFVLIMRNVSDKSVQKIKKTFYVQKSFLFGIRAVYDIYGKIL